jgi:hypothetical protein
MVIVLPEPEVAIPSVPPPGVTTFNMFDTGTAVPESVTKLVGTDGADETVLYICDNLAPYGVAVKYEIENVPDAPVPQKVVPASIKKFGAAALLVLRSSTKASPAGNVRHVAIVGVGVVAAGPIPIATLAVPWLSKITMRGLATRVPILVAEPVIVAANSFWNTAV